MHSPTLLTVTTVLMGMMCLVMFAVWHFNRRIPGLFYWLLCYVVGFVVSALLLLRRDTADPMAVGVTMVCIFWGGYLNLAGARDHVGLPRLHTVYPLVGTGLTAAIGLYFTLGHPNLGARVLLASTVSGLLYLGSAWALAHQGLKQFPARRLMAIACGAHGGFLLLRPWLFKLGTTIWHDEDIASRLSQFVVLEAIVALILLAFCVAMLVNESITVELRRLAEKDSLTGVYNRRAFLDLLEKAGSLARRTQTALPVLLLDLDHFKQVNDRYGHQVGDAVLRHFVSIATPCLRKEDVLGRMGGEEFAIFLPHTPPQDVQRVSERLRAAVATQPLLTEHGPVSLTVSLGSTLCVPGELPEHALHRADQAMYQAKQHGRNQVVSLAAAGA